MRMRVVIFAGLMLFSLICSAQEQSNWDESLDRYELICERCLELKKQEQQGVQISQESLSSLLIQLSMLRNSLSAVQGSMSAAQKARFDMIRRRLGSISDTADAGSGQTGSKPAVQQAGRQGKEATRTKSSPQPAVLEEPSANRLTFESVPPVEYYFNAGPAVQYCKPAERQMQHAEVPVCASETVTEGSPDSKSSFLAAVQTGLRPDFSGGLMLGIGFKKIGVYITGRTNFSKQVAPAYSCDSFGNILGDNGTPVGRIWPDGRQTICRHAVAAGVFVFPNSILSPYAGLGYGVRRYALGDTDGRWASVPDLSATGANLDFGLMLKRGHFLAGIGADLILPSGASHVSYPDLTISAGVSF